VSFLSLRDLARIAEAMDSDGLSADVLIAIVDDDDSARDAVVSLVRSFGFSVVGFKGGADFLRSEHCARVACLIADVRMPSMTGFELHSYLVQSGRPIPTILVTSYRDDAMQARALRAGVQHLLSKPLFPDILLDRIRRALWSSS
jgi:FixJ family two-component response regulator